MMFLSPNSIVFVISGFFLIIFLPSVQVIIFCFFSCLIIFGWMSNIVCSTLLGAG